MDVMIQQYRQYQNPAGIGRPAMALGRECVFGEDVMAASVGGPKLSKEGTAFIQQTLHHLFPDVDDMIFKSYWNAARHVIAQACTRAGEKSS